MLTDSIDIYQIPLRYWYLGLNAIIIFVSFEICFMFLKKGISLKKELVGTLNIAFGIGFGFIAVNFIVKLINFFISIDPLVFQKYLYISSSGVAALVVILIEPAFRKNRLFSIVSIIDVFLFTFIDPFSNYIIIAIGWTAIILIFPVQIFVYILKNMGDAFKKNFAYLLISVLILYSGITITMERNVALISSEFLYIIGHFLLIIGLTGIYFSFYEVDVFIENGWQNHLLELYIVHKNTLQLLFHKNLTKSNQESNIDSDRGSDISLFSGGIVGITSLLKEITNSKVRETQGISLIDLKGKELMLEYGQDTIFCFVVDKNLNALRYFLKKIRDTWEYYYCTKIIDWNNVNQNMFLPMESIVKDILERKESKSKIKEKK